MALRGCVELILGLEVVESGVGSSYTTTTPTTTNLGLSSGR